MSASRIGCLVLDIDDTLYLERAYVRSGCRAVGRWLGSNLGLDSVEDRLWDAFEEGVRGELFDVVLHEYGIPVDPELISELVAVYRGHRPNIAMLQDARRLLERASSEAESVAVLSDGPLPSQRAKVQALELTRWANPIVLTADLGEGFGKPHPLGFHMIEQTTGHRGDACLYVADNPSKDFQGPKSLGWRTVRIRRPQSLHQASPSGNDVDREISTLDDLLRGPT